MKLNSSSLWFGFIFILCLVSPSHSKGFNGFIGFESKHGAQGTGNYKGKRDRHEKPTPMHEKKRQSTKWLPHKK